MGQGGRRQDAAEYPLPLVLDAIGDAVYAMDPDERIQFANRRALELWGKARAEVIGRRILEVFPDIANGEPYQAYRRVLTDRVPVHIETTAPAMNDRWIELDAHPAPDGGLVVVFRDIDERKRSEAALRDSEERFRTMLEAFPQIAFVIQPNGVAEIYNQQFRDYVGGPIGLDLDSRNELLHPDDRPRLIVARAEAVRAGQQYTIEIRLRRFDGVYRWHRLHNRPMRQGGRIAYWLGTAFDIDDMREANALLERRVAARTGELEATNRRLAAQIEEREKAETQLLQTQRVDAVGQLTSGVAHDFNNLLTAILGNLEMLGPRLDPRDGRAARLLLSAQNAAERGARLTAQLLAFSRKQRMAPQRIDLNRIVAGMGALLQSTIGATVKVEMELAGGLWPALADPSQIELVLLNLAINARDAMPGGGTIHVSTANARLGPPARPVEPPAGDYVAVSVIDSGTGIAPDILDKIFEPFFTTKEIGKGSGLGLSQVLGVAQQLGGGVGITTGTGEGTTVSVYLPRARDAADADDVGVPGWQEHAGASRHREGVILLVDDDEDVRAVTAAMLRESGHAVIEAGSGGAALDRLAREGSRIEALILDFAMPGMNGVEVARAVLHSRPEMPILFVTGYADTALLADYASADRILQKPFRANALAAKVAELLGENGLHPPVA